MRQNKPHKPHKQHERRWGWATLAPLAISNFGHLPDSKRPDAWAASLPAGWLVSTSSATGRTFTMYAQQSSPCQAALGGRANVCGSGRCVGGRPTGAAPSEHCTPQQLAAWGTRAVRFTRRWPQTGQPRCKTFQNLGEQPEDTADRASQSWCQPEARGSGEVVSAPRSAAIV